MAAQWTAVSLFSGCGGFDWGASQAGVDVIWANDIDPYASSAYKSLFPDIEHINTDIRNIRTFPEADILIGCYPCTGFSVAARRRWKDLKTRDLKANDTNFLYLEFLRALKQVKPKFLFVENVKGMRSANGGWFLQQQLEGFREAGYRLPTPLLLDAANYGVPQIRKRLFIVGVRKDIDFHYQYPAPSFGPGTPKSVQVLKDAISGMDEWPEGEFCDKDFHGHYLTRNRKRSWEEPSFTIVAHGHHVPLHPMGEPMVNIGKDAWALQGDNNRRLSWRECARIQGLPDYISPSGSLMDKYRVIGNAVPPALGKALLEPITSTLNFKT